MLLVTEHEFVTLDITANAETKLWLSLSAKWCRNLCSGLPSVYQDLSMCLDTPVKKAIVDLPMRLKGDSKHTSDNC